MEATVEFCNGCGHPKHRLMVCLLPNGEVVTICKECDARITKEYEKRELTKE